MALLLSLLILPATHAQTSPTRPSAYDIISIKPDKSGSGSVRVNTRDNLFEASNVSLKSLLQTAYNIKEDLISGIPSGFTSPNFDIQAKVLDPDLDALKKLTPEQRTAWHQSLMQQLLADRFHLKAHIETKELPVYELVLAKGGPTLKEPPPEAAAGTDAPKPPNALRRGFMSTHSDGSVTELSASAVPITNLVTALSYQVHRTVIDKTGLTAKYDISLKWAPEDAPPPKDNSTESAPSIFTALQEQLGLKLQAAKGPVDTLVVDHVELPTENE